MVLATVVASVAAACSSPHPGAGRSSGRDLRRDTGASPSVVSEPATPSGPAATWVSQENAKPGTSEWRLTAPAGHGEIEGYLDRVSAQQGDTVRAYISTTAPTEHVEAYRMGYYQGLGGRLIWQSPETAGVRQPAPTVRTTTNTVEAQWHLTMTVSIDAAWPPGQYLFKLVASTGQQQYMPLTVRDDASHAAFLVQSSVTTWQAYNSWGGYNLYEGKHGDRLTYAHRARIVSFDRPYAFGDGAGDFLGLEYPLVSLMESKGLDVAYTTNIDVHERPYLLLAHRAVLSLGHDEYWSTAMRDGFETARDHGTNLAFFGANAAFRHIRLAPSSLGLDREIVDYKEAREDPLLRTDPSEVTVNWPDPPVSRPANTLIGNTYRCNPVTADLVVTDSTNWLFAGTGLHDGAHLAGVVGSEYDRYLPEPGVPSGVHTLAHSPLRCHGHADFADTTYYTWPSGAGVFASGTINWIPKLAATCDTCPGTALAHITGNLLSAFGAGPAGTSGSR